ncbi:MAG: metallophosphoesterase family protein, partial [Candidatus Binatia bacterium]
MTTTTGKLGVRWWRVAALLLTLASYETQFLHAGEREAKRFSFVVLGHVRGEANGKMNPLLPEVIAKIRKQAPDLIFLTGDMIWGDVHSVVVDAEAIKRDWELLDAALDRLGVPIYRVPGNHDIADPVTRDIYFARYGELPQAFTYRGSRFILLNSSWVPEGSESPPSKRSYTQIRGTQLGSKQIEFIRKELSEPHRYDHVFLFMHHLLWWHRDEMAWWREVHPLLVGRDVRAVFGGDLGPMKFSHMRRDGIDYVQTSIEGIPSIGILRELNSSRLLSQQFDNFLHVKVDGPRVTVEVETVGEISTGNFTPQRWRAVDEYERPLMKRVQDFIGNTRRLMTLA